MDQELIAFVDYIPYGTLLLYCFIIIVVWLIFRGPMCWYWKINRFIELEEDRNRLLKRLVDKLEKETTSKT